MTAQTGMAKMAKIQRGTAHLEPRTVLLACSTLALIIIDYSHLTLATAVGAIVLAAFVFAYSYFPRLHEPTFAIYGFIIAQLSPISLQADLVTAVAYQVVCALFLTAIIVPFPRFSAHGSGPACHRRDYNACGVPLVQPVAHRQRPDDGRHRGAVCRRGDHVP